MSLGLITEKTGSYALISLKFHINNALVVLIEKLYHVHHSDSFFHNLTACILDIRLLCKLMNFNQICLSMESVAFLYISKCFL